MQPLDAKIVRNSLGETIRIHRTQMGISQEKLAELIDVHRNYIGKIERGEQNITINSLVRFCNLFECSLAELFEEAEL
jgi:transcriptional regulator with XRE-family HTH domain